MMLGDGFPTHTGPLTSDDAISRRELQPVQFAASTLLQPTERHFAALDDVADCFEFMESIQPDDAFHVLHAALEYIKLSRSLLRVCDDFYSHHIDAPTVEEAMGEMRQITKDSRLDAIKPSASRANSPAKEHNHSPSRQANDDGHGRAPLHRCDDESPQKRFERQLPPTRHWLRRLQDVFSLGLPKVSFTSDEDDPELHDDAAPLITNDELSKASSSPVKSSDRVVLTADAATAAEKAAAPVPPLVVNTIQAMVDFPANLKLQFRGLHVVAEFAKARENHDAAVVVLTQLEGFHVIVRATEALATSQKAQLVTLSLLGNPDMVAACAHVLPVECRRLIRSAMARFPTSARVQGLGCLALANLASHAADVGSALDQAIPLLGWDVDSSGVDEIVAAMKQFQDSDTNVQAAGAWALASVCRLHVDLVYAALDAGALNAVERCKASFPDDPRVQANAELAIAQLLHRPVPLPQNDGCVLQ